MRWVVIAIIAMAGPAVASQACAHDFRSGLVTLNEVAPGRYAVTVSPAAVEVSFVEPCAINEGTLRCPQGGLTGLTLSVAPRGVAGVVVQINRLEEPTETVLLASAGESWHPGDDGFAASVGIGIGHVAAGYDHLLFLLLLVFLVRRPRKLFVVATTFTLAHAATVALAASEVLTLPAPPVEAVIALSIVFLARELARERHGMSTAAAAAFGLVHGLGFAGVLSASGFAGRDLATALVGFNVGVEVAQITFIVLMVAVSMGLQRLALPPRMLRLAVAYSAGAIAFAALTDRTLALLGGPL